jgi:hypothetical protein
MAYRTVLPLAVLTLLSVLPASAATVRVSPDDYLFQRLRRSRAMDSQILAGFTMWCPFPALVQVKSSGRLRRL